jgi:tetratricopeptide (TPR) repeat protein
MAAGQGWIPYLLALLAVGLLPVRRRAAHIILCLLLALLWVSVASRALADSPPSRPLSYWGALAILEALLFAGLGAIGGKARLEARHGAWAVLGAVFLVYSLLVFPVLGQVFDILVFRKSVFELPFPLVLFTCGILFFAPGAGTDFLLGVPLFWALWGGPGNSLDRVEIVGLQVALLAGAFFLSLPPELRGASDGRPVLGEAYRTAYRRRILFGYFLWALLLAVGFFFLLQKADIVKLPEIVLSNFALLCGLGVLLWLVFPAWQSPWYRYIAWWASRIGGRVWVWTSSAWRAGILLLGAAALLFMLGRKYAEVHGLKKILNQIEYRGYRFGQENWPLWPFLTAVLVWLAFQIYQGRRRLVIGKFTVHGIPGDEASWATGLGPRLENELARIAGVYRVIDEARPSSKASLIEVTPGVTEVGTILEEASALDLGPTVKLPTKLLASTMSLLVSGPRLTGSLHKIGSDLTLMAELSGGGLVGNWRVGKDKLSEEEKRLPEAELINKLVEQLAFRIATDLVSIGSPRWQAVRCFTDGLRAYRETQRQAGDSAKLREAERALIQALKDDHQFTQCHYNLGVVYLKLGELGSAESAFRSVLRECPSHFEACYALAQTLVEAKRFRESLWFCEVAITMNASDPRAWDLAAYAFRYSAQESCNMENRVALPPSHRSWSEVRERSEIAVALAWRSMCRRAWHGPSADLEKIKSAAFLCTRDLAVVLTRAGSRFEDSRQIFRQAAWLYPYDPDLRLYEGRALLWSRKWKSAAEALEGVLEEGLESPHQGLLWSTLAQAAARVGPWETRSEAIRLAHSRFLDLAATANPEDLEKIINFSLEPSPVLQEQS